MSNKPANTTPSSGLKRLAVFTPLAPHASGTAILMEAVLPLLGERFECDVYLDREHGTECYLGDTIHLLHHTSFESNAARYGMILYHLGDPYAHEYMLPYMERYPGTVLMHEVKEGLLGPEWRLLAPEITKQIIVHHELGVEALSRRGLKHVRLLRQPVKLPLMISLLTVQDFVFTAFGTNPKPELAEALLRNLGKMRAAGENITLRLQVAGVRADSFRPQLEELAEELELSDVIRFIQAEDFSAVMTDTDVCVCLDEEWNGDVRDSLLDALSYGKPIIALKALTQGELPGLPMFGIPSGGDIEESLYKAMLEVNQNKSYLRKQKRQAKAYLVERHSPARYADQLAGWLESEYGDERTSIAGLNEYAGNGSEPVPPIVEAPGEESPAADEGDGNEEPESAAGERTLQIYPNRYYRIRSKNRWVAYCSFDLSVLPPECSLVSAAMNIRVYSQDVRIHRIKAPWSRRSLSRREPALWPNPIYKERRKYKRKRRGPVNWDCTALAEFWRNGANPNHGLYIPYASSLSKPTLTVTFSVSQTGEENGMAARVMKSLQVACIGSGYVGSVTGTAFAVLGHSVTLVDSDRGKVELIQSGRSPVFEPGLDELTLEMTRSGRLSATTDYDCATNADVVFIAVGTPSLPDGAVDLTYVKSAARSIGKALSANPEKYTVIVNKSTVPVGTAEAVASIVEEASGLKRGEHFDVVSNPEFLREGCALEDVFFPDRIVIGAGSDRARTIMRELYEPLLSRNNNEAMAKLAPFRSPPHAPQPVYFETDTRSSELIKYVSNAFLAVKISYINEVAKLCEALGANVTDVARGMGMDSRIGDKFLQVSAGWSGSCFPKDTSELLAASRKAKAELSLVNTAIEANIGMHDYCVEKMIRRLGTLDGKRVGVLGLTFKPDTDDARQTQASYMISKMVRLGAQVAAHDPKGMRMFQEQNRRLRVQYCDAAEDVANQADAVMLLTHWKEYAQLDWGKMLASMKTPYVLDTRNFLPVKQLVSLGFDYEGLGIGT